MAVTPQNEAVAGLLTVLGLCPYFSGISAVKDGTVATQLDVVTSNPVLIGTNGRVLNNPGTIYPATQNIAVPTVNGTYTLYATWTDFLDTPTVSFYVASAIADAKDVPIATILVAGNVISTVTAISPGPLAGAVNKQDIIALTNTVARTDTTAKVLGTLPAGANVVGLYVSSPTASNAGTTATLSVGIAGTAGKFVNALDVKGATGAGQVFPTPTASFGAQGIGPAQTIQGIYAETGGASSAGGPWTVVLLYTL